MRQLLEEFARALVLNPSDVHVSETRDGEHLHLELVVAASDRGRVIGRSGRTAGHLRALLDFLAHRRGARCSLEIRG